MAKNCPSCNKIVEEWFKYCDACGIELNFKNTCASCNNLVAVNSKFCNRCGEKVEYIKSSERKEITRVSDEGSERIKHVAPPKFSKGAVDVLVKSGFPIPKEIQDCIPLAKELFIALPDKDTGKYKFNENFLGLENNHELLGIFRNFITEECRHNYLLNTNRVEKGGHVVDLKDSSWN